MFVKYLATFLNSYWTKIYKNYMQSVVKEFEIKLISLILSIKVLLVVVYLRFGLSAGGFSYGTKERGLVHG